nr:hypothetical protein [Aquabacterium sp. CECT 9606]
MSSPIQHKPHGKPAETILRDDGLRYQSKAPGSPFANGFAGGIGSMSCFFCGAHRGASLRVMQKVLGRSQPVCQPPCGKNPRHGRDQQDS